MHLQFLPHRYLSMGHKMELFSEESSQPTTQHTLVGVSQQSLIGPCSVKEEPTDGKQEASGPAGDTTDEYIKANVVAKRAPRVSSFRCCWLRTGQA